MNEQIAADIFKQAIVTTLIISAPTLLAALVTGVIISLIQAVMQLHEVTLTFIPKIMVTLIVLIITLPWMMQVLGNFTLSLFANIPAYIGK